jgi:hypothetical protein
MGYFKISRQAAHDSYRSDRVSWLDRFAEEYNDQKSSEDESIVDLARKRSERSLHDQISYVVTYNPRYSSVESAIREMQKRVGLGDYLNSVSSSNEAGKNKKVAFQENPELKKKVLNFCLNRIKTHGGHIHIPALQEEALAMFKTEGVTSDDVEDESFVRELSSFIVAELEAHPSTDQHSADLGRGVGLDDEDDDNANSDFFRGLTPETQR